MRPRTYTAPVPTLGTGAVPCPAHAADALLRVRAAGGEVLTERTLVAPGVGYQATFRDPAGTTMGLFERAREGATGS